MRPCFATLRLSSFGAITWRSWQAASQGKDRLAHEVEARTNEVLGEWLVSRVLMADKVTQP